MITLLNSFLAASQEQYITYLRFVLRVFFNLVGFSCRGQHSHKYYQHIILFDIST